MKRLFAVVLAVVMLATIGGVATAANYQETGNGSLSGPHYNLNIISVSNTKTADMTNTQGHTIFVKEKGRTKILLFNSDDPDNDCRKDFVVLDRNGTDGEAMFCLPEPDIVPCPEDATKDSTSYTFYARALGTPGGKSFTTTCAEDAGETYCSSITMKLVREEGKSTFQDVSKYLLVLYLDLDGDVINDDRVPLFDDSLENYFWQYDNNGLKLAQLRFYETPSECLPEYDEVGDITSITLDPECVIPDTDDVTVTITANNADFTNADWKDIDFFDADGPVDGITVDNNTVNGGVGTLTFDIDIADDVTPGEITMYVTEDGGETMNITFTVEESCA
jgi:hypothetical protein